MRRSLCRHSGSRQRSLINRGYGYDLHSYRKLYCIGMMSMSFSNARTLLQGSRSPVDVPNVSALCSGEEQASVPPICSLERSV